MSSDVQIGGDGTRGSLSEIPAEWYETLRHPRRIRLLEVLRSGESPFTLTELTGAVARQEADDEADGQLYHEVRISLVHNHLPRLAEYGILEWDDETVVLEDDTPLPLRDLSRLLERCDAQDRLLEVLVHPVRTQLYSILRERERPVSVDRLASELATREAGSLSDPEEARISLHHSHLPAMDDVGALEFDRESGTVRRSDRSTPSVSN
ncbi:hypothetical protein CV102_00455 [Natronococcus pandeyae]|uniref:DUF7344 domain-containing protein n=1 Tax=Natronococcus pandeyae TaxID=2055836 RepID=A0A8J8TTU3_9EURY|nr:hypothetical protein [Natronococcus pandeyae]TYL40087.1 hypothetical protein CV102_00455 [Natronococcus pandeyae]